MVAIGVAEAATGADCLCVLRVSAVKKDEPQRHRGHRGFMEESSCGRAPY
jgi:hypothetical protein